VEAVGWERSSGTGTLGTGECGLDTGSVFKGILNSP